VLTQPTERRARAIRVGAWFVATALIVLLVRTVDPARALRVVAHTNGWWLLAAVAANLLIQPLGALQWRSLLPDGADVSFRRMLRLFTLTSVANNTTPSLIGHATGALLLASEPEIGKTGALTVVALDQIAVGVVKVAIIGCAAALISLPQWMERGLAGLGFAVVVMFVAAIVTAKRTRHFGALREPIRFLRGVACALGVKGAEAGAILAVQQAFGLDVSVQSVIVVLAASALGSVVPIAPANIGTYEAASYGAYRFLGFNAETALGIAVVQHVCQLLPAVGAGYVLLSVPKLGPRNPPLRV
jgi:uncharacterized membrane protein YbhN (UPF0104 family)